MSGPATQVAGARPPSPPSHQLDRSLVTGIVWTGAVRWLAQLLTWLSTIVAARLLSPADYGLVGMAVVYLGFVHLINEFGLGTALVQRRDLGTDDLARLGGLSLLLGLGFFGVSALVAGPLAHFFGEPAVRSIVVVGSLAFVTSGFQVLPRALLARELRFRRLALADGIEAISGAAATLVLVFLGLAYWSLVLGPLAGRAGVTVLLLRWRPHRLAWPRPYRAIAGPLAFGRHLTVSRIAWYLYSNADFAIVGRLLGKAALGAYTLGWTIASVPVERFTALFASLIPAVFAAAQHDRARVQRYLKALTEGLSLVTFPAAVGLSLVANDLVPFLFGNQWQSAVLPLRLLALSAALRSVTPLLPQVAVAMGEVKQNLRHTAIASVALPVFFLVGSHWGTTGVALAWLVGHPLCVVPLFLAHVLKLTGLPFLSYLGALWPAAWATAVMTLVVLSLQFVTAAMPAAGARLALSVTAGASTYAMLVYLTHGRRVRQLYRLFRGLQG